LPALEAQLSKETPKDDPRQRTDEGSHSQTDKPRKRNPEKEQRSGTKKSDPDKWQETNTLERKDDKWDWHLTTSLATPANGG
jgi:hypothetical protein